MGRPKGPPNVAARLRGFELYAAGLRKSDIARELGVTRAAVTDWSHKDEWEARLNPGLAEAAADFATTNQTAAALVRLKGQVSKRINELELLCGPSHHPTVRLRAIAMWLKLAGVDSAIPPPKDHNPSLELVDDTEPEDS